MLAKAHWAIDKVSRDIDRDKILTAQGAIEYGLIAALIAVAAIAAMGNIGEVCTPAVQILRFQHTECLSSPGTVTSSLQLSGSWHPT